MKLRGLVVVFTFWAIACGDLAPEAPTQNGKAGSPREGPSSVVAYALDEGAHESSEGGRGQCVSGCRFRGCPCDRGGVRYASPCGTVERIDVISRLTC
jgi:hypothetical protein